MPIITVRQPCARWEFDFENENIRGHWTGIFRDRDGLSTEVEFTETARAKKFWMKPFVKADPSIGRTYSDADQMMEDLSADV